MGQISVDQYPGNAFSLIIFVSAQSNLEINDALLMRAQRLAAERQQTLKSILETALRQFLDANTVPQTSFRLRKHPFQGRGLQPHLAESGATWAIPWPCIHEFVAIVTHPRIYDPPTPLGGAIEQVECWLEAPALILLGKSPGYWQTLRNILEGGRGVGPQVHDARIAALCTHNGITELWTAGVSSFVRGLALPAVFLSL